MSHICHDLVSSQCFQEVVQSNSIITNSVSVQKRIHTAARAAVTTKVVFSADSRLVSGNLSGKQFPELS